MERISKNKYKVEKHGNKKERKKLTKKQKIFIVLGIIFSIFVILGIVIGTYIYKADGNVANAAINMIADVVGDENPVTVLVLGVSEGINVPLTDTIMLAGYYPKTQKAFVVSIPRDTYIGKNDNYADGYSKINSAYQKGVKKTVTEVEKLTGVEIDYYVVVKTSALIQIVDAIGGVEFDVPIDMDYDDPTQNLHIHLEAGMQLIDGAKAEQLLRFRHNNDGSSYPSSYGDNDYGRMRTQREFIKATATQIIQWENMSKIKDIASAIFSNLETNMSLAKMVGYIPSVLKFDMSSLQMNQLPGQSERINNLWFYTHDLSKTKKLMTELMQSLGLSEKDYKKMYTPISTKSNRIRKTEEIDNTIFENTITNTITDENTITNTNTNTNTNNNTTNTNTNTNINTNTNTNTGSNNTIVEECNHNWTSKIEKEPTCEVKGSKILTCTLCEKTKTETIKATGHTWIETGREEPTTVVEGTIYYKCSVPGCDGLKTETIPVKQPETPAPNPEPTPTPQPEPTPEVPVPDEPANNVTI